MVTRPGVGPVFCQAEALGGLDGFGRRANAALDAARAGKDDAAAEAIRAELQAEGWTVETTKDGTTVRR